MMRRTRRPFLSKWRCVSTVEEREQMHALRARGLSLRQIGRSVGRDHHTVRHCLKHPVDYRIKQPDRLRDHRGCFVGREYLQQRAQLTAAEQEVKALSDRLEAAQRGQPLSAQELLDVQQRMRRLEALVQSLRPASGRARSSIKAPKRLN